ncbi:TraB/GumN family protein [Vibrio sp.]|uniref:TraB/GumN family protein n=1 Tax=Vibrio sp. TaxID=678 RepID=UPI003D0BAAEC
MRLWILLLPLLVSFNSFAEPLYWLASRPPLQLLITGSVHVGKPSMYPLPSYISEFLRQSNGLVIETDLNQASQVQYPDVTVTSQDVLTADQQQQLAEIIEELQLNRQTLMASAPWATALAIQIAQMEKQGYFAHYGVDVTLIRQAAQHNVPRLALEPLQFQIDLLANQPEGNKELLLDVLQEYHFLDQGTECLIQSWQAGDLDNLERFRQLTELSDQFEQQFIQQRNLDWARKLASDQLFPENGGQYTVVVGTLHLIGENNLIALLEQQGFKVEQRSVSKRAECDFDYSAEPQ